MYVSQPVSPHAGFTLIELLVAMSLAALLLAIALPSFNQAIQRNRITTQTNEMITAFSLARTEAIRRNRIAVVCSSSDNATCGGTWNNGWIVWVDDNRNGTPSADELLRTGSLPESTNAGAKVAGVDTFDVRFNTRGRRTVPASTEPVEMFFGTAGVVCDDSHYDYFRRLHVSPTGTVSAIKIDEDIECIP